MEEEKNKGEYLLV